jgi:hypothetical protein
MISADDARLRAEEHLQGFPPDLVAAYLDFARAPDATRLDPVVFGMLHFYLAKPPPTPLTALPGTTRLIEDLGCDSLTMADLLFLAETLFGITLADAEVAQITTLDALRDHFRRAVIGTAEIDA